jgi:hypothetical protein
LADADIAVGSAFEVQPQNGSLGFNPPPAPFRPASSSCTRSLVNPDMLASLLRAIIQDDKIYHTPGM